MDFLRRFGIQIDDEIPEWSFRSDPCVKYSFSSEQKSKKACCALPELTPSERQQLSEFITKRVPTITASSGATSLIEHKIDIGQHPPVK